jgi:hypothetical protein
MNLSAKYRTTSSDPRRFVFKSFVISTTLSRIDTKLLLPLDVADDIDNATAIRTQETGYGRDRMAGRLSELAHESAGSETQPACKSSLKHGVEFALFSAPVSTADEAGNMTLLSYDLLCSC